MWGDEFRHYFELYSTFVVYGVKDGQPDDNQGWFDAREYEKRLKDMLLQANVTLGGKTFDSKASNAKGELIDALVNSMGNLITLKLFERRRQTWPPLLEYRKTRIGMWLYTVGHSGNFVKRFFYRVIFFIFGVHAKFHGCWKIVTFLAIGMVMINAAKFLDIAFQEVSAVWIVLVGLVGIAITLIGKTFFDSSS